MSIELIDEDDGVIVEKETSTTPTTDMSTTSVADDIATTETKQQSASSTNSSSSSSSSASLKDLVKKVDEAESATDQPKSTKYDAAAVKLPHLPSPFDRDYPRSRGGDRWKPLCEDGHCMISVLEEGDGNGNVPVLHRVYVNVVGKLEDGTTFLDYPVEELDFILGQAQVPKGLEMAVCQMSLNQHALIRCYSDYGYSTTRRPPNVPGDATLFMEVRVLRWEKEKNLHEMTLEDKFNYCESRRQQGKILFTTGQKPLSSIKQYEKALTVLDSIMNHENSPTTIEKKNELLVLFWVNQAQCWTKVPDMSKVVELCNKAIKFHPKHVKALYRRAEARKAREEWDEAEADYQRVIDIQRSQSGLSESELAAVPDKERVDPLVLDRCHSALKSITARRSSQASSQRRRMDGFLKRASEGLYEDMPMVSPTAPKPDPEPDYSWMNQYANKTSPIEKVKQMWTTTVDFFRSWCQKKTVTTDEGKEE